MGVGVTHLIQFTALENLSFAARLVQSLRRRLLAWFRYQTRTKMNLENAKAVYIYMYSAAIEHFVSFLSGAKSFFFPSCLIFKLINK